MPPGPFTRIVSLRDRRLKLKPEQINIIYDALENMPLLADMQSPVNLQGVLTSTGDLPDDGNTTGDAYLVNGVVWVWDGTAWTNQGSLTTGPQGDAGPQGEIGPQPDLGGDGEATTAAKSDHQHKGTGTGTVALGSGAVTALTNDIALGAGATATGFESVAVGSQAVANRPWAIAIGDSASAEDYTVAIGKDAGTGGGRYGAAVGPLSWVDDDFSVAIGYASAAWGGYSTAIGEHAHASGLRAIGIGRETDADGPDCVAVGYFANVPVDSPRSMAIGANSAVPAATPDTAVLKVNDIDVQRSNGAGATRIALYSPNGTKYWLSVSDAGALVITAG